MTADRAKRLDEIGFIWNVSKRRIGARHMQCSTAFPKQKPLKTFRKDLTLPEVSYSVVSPSIDDALLPMESSADIAAARVLVRMH